MVSGLRRNLNLRPHIGMIDLEREHLRKTYQICRIGFSILTAALVPACLHSLLLMIGALLHDRNLLILVHKIANSPCKEWIETLSVWGSLIGTMLLWGRWDHKSWQRRTGLLLVLSLIDLVSWFVEHGKGNDPELHAWFRENLGEALGWAEFAASGQPCRRLPGASRVGPGRRLRAVDAFAGRDRRRGLDALLL